MYLQLHLENDFITLNIISIFLLVCEVGGDQVHKVGDQVHEGFTWDNPFWVYIFFFKWTVFPVFPYIWYEYDMDEWSALGELGLVTINYNLNRLDNIRRFQEISVILYNVDKIRTINYLKFV